jgi:hypothetical protein
LGDSDIMNVLHETGILLGCIVGVFTPILIVVWIFHP